jgi:hypothetical protein
MNYKLERMKEVFMLKVTIFLFMLECSLCNIETCVLCWLGGCEYGFEANNHGSISICS